MTTPEYDLPGGINRGLAGGFDPQGTGELVDVPSPKDLDESLADDSLHQPVLTGSVGAANGLDDFLGPEEF